MELARIFRVNVALAILALTSVAAGGAGDPGAAGRSGAWPADGRVVQAGHRFAVGDIVCRNPVASGHSLVRTAELRPALEARRVLGIVTAVRTDEFTVASLEHDVDLVLPHNPSGAVLWPAGRADGPGLTLRSDRAAYTRRLAEGDTELLVRQHPNGFRPGDVVCLNEGSGSFVRVAVGALRDEFGRGTRLFLVTQERGDNFLVSRIPAERTGQSSTHALPVGANQNPAEYVRFGIEAAGR